MTAKFFEAIYKGKRFVGIENLEEKSGFLLYETTLKNLFYSFKRQMTAEAAQKYLRDMVPSISIANNSFAELTLIPPLSPDPTSDVLVSGFMQTHNVKIDQHKINNNDLMMPNWFIKGLSSSLKVSGAPLMVPTNPIAICEEAEVVLIYIDDEFGQPYYCGYTFGNDLTDIGRFKRNNGHLSYAKLCDAAVSTWFYLEPPPKIVHGQVTIERNGGTAWQGVFNTGLTALGYHLTDMINHLFSFPAIHHPGRTHYIFLGADRSSYHHGFVIEKGDRIVMNFLSHGIIIENTINAFEVKEPSSFSTKN